ncbi:hypothetical protein M0R19_04215 [Candidatus Pacearchaeota archaeon]|nr:hypothetical protein [Candidatus Pacearchaeota archaeon]
MGILKKLTEDIVRPDMILETNRLVKKWSKTGLLEGLDHDEYRKHTVVRLLENQAASLLREATTMEGGDVQGFASVAFPLVRRVFAGLLANDVVSVQPMSLPSGLIFFLDFRYNSTRGPLSTGGSIYGTDSVASEIANGVSITDPYAEKGLYNLNNSYSHAIGYNNVPSESIVLVADAIDLDGTVTDAQGKLIQWDEDLIGKASYSALVAVALTSTFETHTDGTADWDQFNVKDYSSINLLPTGGTALSSSMGQLVRRLTCLCDSAGAPDYSAYPLYVRFVFLVATANVDASFDADTNKWSSASATSDMEMSFSINDNISEVSSGIGAVVGGSVWQLENEDSIPEINIKVDSIPIVAQTRKLKAVWTPEAGQDLQAYHSTDAETELTSVLSEHIGMEIDGEILQDLVKGATARTYYWSRRPGLFVNRETGADITSATAPPDFTGNVSEWYQTLLETINDVSAEIHRKTLRGGANFLVCGPETSAILEMVRGFSTNVTAPDDEKGSAGSIKVGSISNKWDIYVSPYFYRNVILVGRKGSSFLESGYVYSPYVPLQTTPVIFDPENFTPRKGVMTRYGKKMVRPDMYGLVIIRDLQG